MRESEEYLESNVYYSSVSGEGTSRVLFEEDAEHAVKLAYKEGYLEARADILEELRKHDKDLFMMNAIVFVRQMKLPENLFK